MTSKLKVSTSCRKNTKSPVKITKVLSAVVNMTISSVSHWRLLLNMYINLKSSHETWSTGCEIRTSCFEVLSRVNDFNRGFFLILSLLFLKTHRLQNLVNFIQFITIVRRNYFYNIIISFYLYKGKQSEVLLCVHLFTWYQILKL